MRHPYHQSILAPFLNLAHHECVDLICVCNDVVRYGMNYRKSQSDPTKSHSVKVVKPAALPGNAGLHQNGAAYPTSSVIKQSKLFSKTYICSPYLPC